jgi:hypothetical protein
MPSPPPAPSAQPSGIGAYLKAAFTYHWNLLILGGAVVASLISGHADALLPIVAAGELAYMTTLISNSRFRRAIDARPFASSGSGFSSSSQNIDADQQLTELLRELGPGPRRRFLQLREKCLTMGRLARGMGAATAAAEPSDSMRNEGLDKLLWVFLKLLHSQQSLWHFLEETDEPALSQQLADLEKRRKALGEKPDERLLRTLTDAIATATMRLDNLGNAKKNSEFVDLELDRIENKILALSEMAVNNQNPDFISTQVDAVADSITQTESAMHELNQLTGISRDLSSAPPKILQTNIVG